MTIALPTDHSRAYDVNRRIARDWPLCRLHDALCRMAPARTESEWGAADALADLVRVRTGADRLWVRVPGERGR